MAKVDPQARLIRGPNGRVTEIVSWGPMSAGDEIGFYDFSKSETGHCNSVQVEGELSGAECQMEGSNDGINGRRLHDLAGMEAIISGASGIVGIGQATRYIRPVLAGGDKLTKITVTAYGRSA